MLINIPNYIKYKKQIIQTHNKKIIIKKMYCKTTINKKKTTTPKNK